MVIKDLYLRASVMPNSLFGKAFISVKECREFTLKFFFICLFYVDGDVSVSISIIYNVDHTCFFSCSTILCKLVVK